MQLAQTTSAKRTRRRYTRFLGKDKAEASTELRALFWRLLTGSFSLFSGRLDFFSRPIVITPYGGNYDEIAGWIICVQGSPPKGTIMVEHAESSDEFNFDSARFYYVVAGRSRRVGGESQSAIVRDFCRSVIGKSTEAFIVEGEQIEKCSESTEPAESV